MLTPLAPLLLALLTSPQASAQTSGPTKQPAKTVRPASKAPVTKQPRAAAPAAATSPTSLTKTTVIRKAECVLVLKGLIQRELAPRTMGSGTGTANRITEQFQYELPGLLEEEQDPGGAVRFRFTPAADLRHSSAKGRLTLQDETPASGIPPVSMEASELVNADPFVFEAAGKGQVLSPVSGNVRLRGRILGGPAAARTATGGPDLRPVSSMPLPSLKAQPGQPGTPFITFQGLALWAWANTTGPLTVSGTVQYRGPSASGRVTGSVDVSFRIAAQVKQAGGA